MSDNKQNGVYKHRTPMPLDNPEIKKSNDWWDEMCKRAGEKNYWSKAKKAATKKAPKKAKK
jgi:hypothetical protein